MHHVRTSPGTVDQVIIVFHVDRPGTTVPGHDRRAALQHVVHVGPGAILDDDRIAMVMQVDKPWGNHQPLAGDHLVSHANVKSTNRDNPAFTNGHVPHDWIATASIMDRPSLEKDIRLDRLRSERPDKEQAHGQHECKRAKVAGE